MSTIAGVLDGANSIYTTSSPASSQSSTGTFSDYMKAAAAEEQPRTRTDTGSQAVKDFLAYANMTPAERMFAAWLHSHKMTQEQFNALPASEQEQIRKDFEVAMRQKMGTENSGTENSGTAAASTPSA